MDLQHNRPGTDPAGEWAARQRTQAAAFDAIGDRYDLMQPYKEGQTHVVDLLVDRLPTGARVLDAGCGTGRPTSLQLADAGCAVTGIDISPVMLDHARRNVPEATFLLRDMVDMDASLGRFHAVTAFFSLLMLPRREIIRTLAVIRELLLPPGWLAIGMVEADGDDLLLPVFGAMVRLTAWPRQQLRQVIVDAGFTVEYEDTQSYVQRVPDRPPTTQLLLLARCADGDE